MISSRPFIKGINCQFPRNIRIEGMYYIVKSEEVRLKNNFYSIMGNNAIIYQTMNFEQIKHYINSQDDKVIPKVIFGDDDDKECIICMDNEKNSVLSPCGHYVVCDLCSHQLKQCPICRSRITCILKRDEIK